RRPLIPGAIMSFFQADDHYFAKMPDVTVQPLSQCIIPKRMFSSAIDAVRRKAFNAETGCFAEFAHGVRCLLKLMPKNTHVRVEIAIHPCREAFKKLNQGE